MLARFATVALFWMAAQHALADSRSILGSWYSDDSRTYYEVHFRSDHTFSLFARISMHNPSLAVPQMGEQFGTWHIAGDRIVLDSTERDTKRSPISILGSGLPIILSGLNVFTTLLIRTPTIVLVYLFVPSFPRLHHAFTAELYAQSVANRVNSFCCMLIGLKSWQSIFSEYTEKERFYLEVEFVSPTLQLAIAEIAGIKNQIAFSVAKVAIQIESNKCTHSIPRDNEISSATWELWASEWPQLNEFRTALHTVNSRDFRATTRDFRNRRAHAIAPSFFGIIPAHVITRDPSGLRIEVRFEEKLEIVTLFSALTKQHVLLVKLIEAMREFLRARLDRGVVRNSGAEVNQR